MTTLDEQLMRPDEGDSSEEPDDECTVCLGIGYDASGLVCGCRF